MHAGTPGEREPVGLPGCEERNAAATAVPRAAPPAGDPVIGTTAWASTMFERDGRPDMLLLATVRAALAVAGLLIIWVAPNEPQRFVGLTYVSLIAYAAYSIGVVLATRRSGGRNPHRLLPWIDVLFASYLVALTEGTSSIFFFFFFFSILSAAFIHGFREGLLVTFASAVLLVLAGVGATPMSVAADTDRFLIRPISLIALGFLISYWGGSELDLKRRLALLRHIGEAPDARLGARLAIEGMLRSLLAFFGADTAILAVKTGFPRQSNAIHIASHDAALQRHGTTDAADETIELFRGVPPGAFVWPSDRYYRRLGPLGTPSRMRETRSSEGALGQLANVLEARWLAIAGYRQNDGTDGRLVLTRAGKPFSESEAAFLAQCAQSMAAKVENITLAEELVARAAEYERTTISRDLHDSAIQPYIGLRMAIQGIARDFRDDRHIGERLSQLTDMTDIALQELRNYAVQLRAGVGNDPGSLAAAIRRQGARLARFYATEVEVTVDPALRLPPETSDAVFQIVTEGLSNIVRHTGAKRARIDVVREPGRCVLQIANPVTGDGPLHFLPRSITERATDLGGRVAVQPSREGWTVVTVSIPLLSSEG